MKHFIFILKTTLISLFIGSVFGILGGVLWSMDTVSHPHQMVPDWFASFIFAAFIASVLGLIIGSLFSFLGKPNLLKALLYTNGIVLVSVIAFLMYFL